MLIMKHKTAKKPLNYDVNKQCIRDRQRNNDENWKKSSQCDKPALNVVES